MPSLRGVGREAEDRAAEWLMEHGYTIVTRRFKGRHGEIDLVALDGELLVFVEVKFRRGKSDRPEDAVGAEKMTRIVDAAAEYLHKVGEPERSFRCDLIAIDGSGVRHYADAFRAP